MGVERRRKVLKPKKELQITFLDLNSLVPHEALVKEELESFKKSVTTLGIFYLPILVAELPAGNFVILDGHHRCAGLKELGAAKIPGSKVDYFSQEVKLGTWYPLATGDNKEIISLLQENPSIKIVQVESREKALSRIDDKKVGFVLLDKINSLIIYGDQKEIISALDKSNSVKLTFTDSLEDLINNVDQEQVNFGLVRKKITKKMVISMAEKGEVFAPKTTRHILPYSISHISVPFKSLF